MATFTDDFERADNASLGASWLPDTNDSTTTGLRILTGTATSEVGSSDASERVNPATVTFSADQIVTVVFGTAGGGAAGSGVGPTCRQSGTAQAKYRAVGSEQGYELGCTKTSFRTLSTAATPVFANGDSLTLKVTGTGATVSWWLYKNDPTGVGASFASGTDTHADRITSGQPGIQYSSTDDGTAASYSAADVGAGTPSGVPRFMAQQMIARNN